MFTETRTFIISTLKVFRFGEHPLLTSILEQKLFTLFQYSTKIAYFRITVTSLAP